MTFIRKTEDFVCEKCGCSIKGDGYTNHCPECLWSKHVDVFPGDRAGNCGGMMKPVMIEKKGKQYIIIHQCEKCGQKKPNKTGKGDNFQAIVQTSANNSFK
ncbi:MAG: hypothetical protein A2566_03045 [Candidatus Zambryskibacteria bacterium RIFOXYD1_FULL_40_13]|nr:MAG: hypothetical protein UU06_C0018G0005 [Parcubacteria group bacterium GW2011_GWB1_40_5]OHA86508.1 MAG: hypothetical protein A2123_00475 [Candidatus Zambryskibacteria bacterium GWB1_40_5]OHB15116.1 MAG: hypothetical protein A2566_03045 [Candidatus Zambryskibacteria bacterium RIFOXYD1_FULL_40_13]HBD24677.1 hypothetical protein [Candidatus Zambryskibacteria bacterium]HBO17358.1 hypothetical protein [Candidatus Zambryskibacteria bacterium]